MNFTIRRASPADARVLARLNQDVQNLHVANEPRFFKPTDPEELSGWHRSFLSRPTCRAWVAETGFYQARRPGRNPR